MLCILVHSLQIIMTLRDIVLCTLFHSVFFFFQAEDGIRDLVRSRGLGDVYKRQVPILCAVTSERCVIKVTDNIDRETEEGAWLFPQELSLIHI